MHLRWLAVLLVLLFGALGACSKKAGPDFFVEVPNAQDVAVGSPVVWRGKAIGQVSAVEPAGKGVRLEAMLNEEFRKELRADLRAAPVHAPTSGGRPVLELYGGRNLKAPRIQQGQQVGAEGGSTASTSTGGSSVLPQILWLAGGFVVLSIVFFIVKGLIKIFIVITCAALAAGVVWCARQGWTVQDFTAAEIEARVSKFAAETLRSPAAVDAWKKLQSKIVSSEDAGPQIEKESEALRSKGDAPAAEELAKLREKLKR